MTCRFLSRMVLGAAFLLPALSFPVVLKAAEEANQDYSEAERLLFTEEHLRNVKPPATLHYSYRKSGTLEEAFQDDVSIGLSAQADGSCCFGKGEFLSGERRLVLPDVENARANPVILYFLENDVRNMHRLTKGQENHFRKRIRMAIYQDATVQPVPLRYQGRAIEGREISISPYLADPNRPRFERYARKQYSFILSDQVPGGLFGIRTRMADADPGAEPLIVEEMFVDGAEPPATTPGSKPSKENR